MSIEAMKQALEALEVATTPMAKDRQEVLRAQAALRQAIAEAEQEQPVGEVLNERGDVDWISFVPTSGTPLYTSPPQRKPLTDDEIWKDDGIMAANSGYGATFDTLREIVRAIEAAHGIKENT